MSQSPLVANNSSDKKRLASALSLLLRRFNLNNNQMLPAQVVGFDRAENRVTLQPLIMWVDVDNQTHSRPQLASIPALSLGGGGFHISFPLKEGDLGWIYAADRDLSLYLQSLAETRPNTGRCHRFEDGMFIPDVLRQYTIDGEDAEAMVIQSTDGATKISIRSDNIKISATTALVVDTPLTTFTGDVVMDKTLTVTTDVKVAGISVIGHGHQSTSPGSRTAGGMEA